MRVLFVVSGNSPFGINPLIKSQGESLINSGIELGYFLIKGKGLKGYLKHIGRLRKELKLNDYDIIHAHYGFCGWVAVLTFKKIPKVVSFMGSDLAGGADESGRIRLSEHFYVYANRLLQLFIDFFIVKSKNLAVHVLFKSKMRIIPNGVDFEQFRPLSKNDVIEGLSIKLEKTKKYILFLGAKGLPGKNFSLLEEAMLRLKDVRLLAPYPIDHSIVPLYLNIGDVLVLTSFSEGSPNVIKEAMACNCPIVSTDVGDVKEVIGDTGGCYIASFDPEDMADKISKALQFGRRTQGREKIKHLEINEIAKRIIKIYKYVLEKS